MVKNQHKDDTILTSEAKYPLNFTQQNERFVSSPHYNGIKSFLFVNTTKICPFKGKNAEIKAYTLCLGNIKKILQLNNIKNGIKRNCKMFFCWF